MVNYTPCYNQVQASIYGKIHNFRREGPERLKLDSSASCLRSTHFFFIVQTKITSYVFLKKICKVLNLFFVAIHAEAAAEDE